MTWYEIGLRVLVETEDPGAIRRTAGEMAELCEVALNHADAVESYDEVRPAVCERRAEGPVPFAAEVGASGNSLTINITKEARRQGLRKGDAVEVCIRRV